MFREVLLFPNIVVHTQTRRPSSLSPQDGFVVRIYTMSSDPALQQELQLKLARKCLHACGISLFDLEKDLHIISECWKNIVTRLRAAAHQRT